MPDETPTATPVGQVIAFIQDELDSASLYDMLAAHESDARISDVYRRLAATERHHADHWIANLNARGVRVPPYRMGWRARVLRWVGRRFGPGLLVPIIASQETADAQKYSRVGDRAAGMDTDEVGHARTLAAIGAGGGAEGATIARLEGRHRATAGNALRAAVLGANDGLLSNLSLIMGVAGASLAAREIVITGIAGLLAGAGSMALGEWLSVQSSRELFQRQIAVEGEEIRTHPREEEEELALIYQAKGLEPAQAKALAARLMAKEGAALDTLAREELGIDPAELGGSALQAASASFMLFALGAIIPLSPFFFLSGSHAVVASLVASAAGLFGIGAGITVLTGRSVWMSGTRQVVVGIAASALTFGIGRLIGVSLQ